MTDNQESLLKLAELFKILGDPTRLKIVELLLENEMCVNHIAETMGMGQSAISHQLRVLRQARLVTYRKDGYGTRISSIRILTYIFKRKIKGALLKGSFLYRYTRGYRTKSVCD